MSLDRLASMRGLSLAHPADVADEVAAADLLEDVTGRSRHDGREQGLVVGVRSQHQAGDLGIGRSNLPAHLDAASIGESHVENGDIGLQRRDLFQPQLGGGGLSDHLHVLFTFEQGLEPCADQLVVIEDENTNRHCDNLATARTPGVAIVASVRSGHPPFSANGETTTLRACHLSIRSTIPSSSGGWCRRC